MKNKLATALNIFILLFYSNINCLAGYKVPTEDIRFGNYKIMESGIINQNYNKVYSKAFQEALKDELNNKNSLNALNGLAPEKHLSFRGLKEVNLYKNISKKVVLIVTKDGIGSGSIIGKNGEILTNWHVVSDYKDVGVIFKPLTEGGKITKADIIRGVVIRKDQISDLALIKVNNLPNGLEPISLGNMEDVIVGADVHAIGHPTGESWTYTKGVISQIRRDYKWSSLPSKIAHTANVIQTQTPINPGNSGGPLISDDEKIIGVNSFKTKGEGLNFAVSIEDIKNFLTSTENRIGHRIQDKNNINEKCEEREIYAGPHKRIKNLHVVAIDLDCDNIAELEINVPKNKKEPIVARLDTNKDRKPDIIILDYEQDGKWDISFNDVDYDGSWDLVGYHPDGKVEASRMEPYNKFIARIDK